MADSDVEDELLSEALEDTESDSEDEGSAGIKGKTPRLIAAGASAKYAARIWQEQKQRHRLSKERSARTLDQEAEKEALDAGKLQPRPLSVLRMLSSFKRPLRSCSISRTQLRAGKSSTRRRRSGPPSRWSLCGIMAMLISLSSILPFPHQRSAVPRARSGCVPTPKTRSATSSRRRRGARAGSASNQATPRGLARIWWAAHGGPDSRQGGSCS